MHALHGELALVRPFATELALRANQDSAPGSALMKSLGMLLVESHAE